jgi:outer membrane protein assembly factor BamE (lipoprotein component of BamABCDE complex)
MGIRPASVNGGIIRGLRRRKSTRKWTPRVHHGSRARRSGWKPLATAALLTALLAGTACAPDTAIRGNLPRPEKLAMVKPGLTTRNDVREILGPPSNVGTFNDKVWYYISQKTEDTPMNVPQVLERTVVAVHFNDTGIVEDVRTLGKDAGRDVSPVARTTPSAGHEPSLLRDLFGNIGKVGADTSSGGGGGGGY